jgi:hypothetical protein
MALVTWIKQKDKIDGTMKSKVYSFFEKLQKDDTAPGLHIEPMHTPADPRVRTGRIDLNYRAVLFKVAFDTIPHYFYYGAWPHDEAIDIARSRRTSGELRQRRPGGHPGLHARRRALLSRAFLQLRQLFLDAPTPEPDVESQMPEEEHGALRGDCRTLDQPAWVQHGSS